MKGQKDHIIGVLAWGIRDLKSRDDVIVYDRIESTLKGVF